MVVWPDTILQVASCFRHGPLRTVCILMKLLKLQFQEINFSSPHLMRDWPDMIGVQDSGCQLGTMETGWRAMTSLDLPAPEIRCTS